MLIELVDLQGGDTSPSLQVGLANMRKVQQCISIYFLFKLIDLLQEPANTELSMLLCSNVFPAHHGW